MTPYYASLKGSHPLPHSPCRRRVYPNVPAGFMSKIVGIDLGTNSLVAVVDSGIPYVIADEGKDIVSSHPSCISRPGRRTGGGTCGHPHPRGKAPGHGLFRWKRFMGRRGSDIPERICWCTYSREGATDPVRGHRPAGRTWTPEEMSRRFWKNCGVPRGHPLEVQSDGR